jgi:hydrogenase maturation protein HypF
VRISIEGIVQGVGFRPTVHRVACGLGLSGRVWNSPAGVGVEVEGPPERVEAFQGALKAALPPAALVVRWLSEGIPTTGEAGFTIDPSRAGERPRTLVSPDLCVCADCLREMRDPRDRRHRYPFLNCTNCGPRFTIIGSLPYDRPATTMRAFRMCPDCEREYHDPHDRRFHAQPNACPACGPRLELVGPDGAPRVGEPLEQARQVLLGGGVLAVKGLGGFHLACDPSRPEVVATLRRRKQRDQKPFAVMVRDLGAARRVACITPQEEALLASPARPIVLVRARADSPLAPEVAPGIHLVGLLLPYTPLHHLLLEAPLEALVMTSANLSDEPIVHTNDAALRELGPLCDALLLHDRDILVRADDSVTSWVAGRERLLRRSRGYVPLPVFLPRESPVPLLAVGGELKNTFAMVEGERAFPSQHVGDLEDERNLRHFEETQAHFRRVLEIEPRVAVRDLHPGYFSTSWAEKKRGTEKAGFERVLAVQHHHAHVLACLAENGHDAPALGLALDGTGFGTDGTAWGSELLRVDGVRFERLFHLPALALPGGDRAVREPWRVALSLLHACLPRQEARKAARRLLDPARFAPERGLDAAVRDQVERLLEAGEPFPRSCGLGRYFDAVSTLCGLTARAAYEGQPAILLEQAAAPGEQAQPYGSPQAEPPDVAAWLACLVQDLLSGTPAALVSARFHSTLLVLFADRVRRAAADTGLGTVALSGGSFQNRCLLGGLIERLEGEGLEVITHSRFPANDGGLALGQAWFGVLTLAGVESGVAGILAAP